jgi:N-acylneuraminate cytidylyltransferase
MARANKLKTPAIQGVDDKLVSINELAKEKGYELSRLFYVGNDLNDFWAMKNCGYTACPSDSHPEIKKLATFQLKTNGGRGVMREILEDILKLDFLEILYSLKGKK